MEVAAITRRGCEKLKCEQIHLAEEVGAWGKWDRKKMSLSHSFMFNPKTTRNKASS